MLTTVSWITPKARLLISGIAGKGLLAIFPIKADEKVVVWKDNYVHQKVNTYQGGTCRLFHLRISTESG